MLPSVSATAPDGPEEPGTFVLGIDGVARARTHGHGAAMRVL